MSKVIAAINVTINGVCDHTAGIANEELHQHYTKLLAKADAILYGKTTYQLMEYWRTVLDNSAEQQSMKDFAVAINKIPKIVFSHTLKSVDWASASLAKGELKETILNLRRTEEKNVLIGSRSLIIQALNLNLVDELQLCIHPLIAGKGLQLFENIKQQMMFKLTKTKTFNNGILILYYQPLVGG